MNWETQNLSIYRLTIGQFGSFIALENAGWKSQSSHGLPMARSSSEELFFRQSMQYGAAQDQVACLALTLDAKPVAMLFSLRSGNHLSAFKTAYNEAYAAYSPGVRLLVEATRKMLQDPSIQIFDSCARQGHPVVDTLWPERIKIEQLNIPTNGFIDNGLLAVAASIEKIANSLRSN